MAVIVEEAIEQNYQEGLENLVSEEDKRSVGFRTRFNSTNRFHAAYLFFRNYIRYTSKKTETSSAEKKLTYKQRLVSLIPRKCRSYLGISTPVPEFYENTRYLDRLVAPIAEPIKKPIIYSTGILGTLLAYAIMRSDRKNKQYIIGDD